MGTGGFRFQVLGGYCVFSKWLLCGFQMSSGWVTAQCQVETRWITGGFSLGSWLVLGEYLMSPK